MHIQAIIIKYCVLLVVLDLMIVFCCAVAMFEDLR